MEICKRCKYKSTCSAASESDFCLNYEPGPLTNADSIRSWGIDQLIAWYCYKRPCGTCPYNGIVCGLREWLEREVDNG